MIITNQILALNQTQMTDEERGKSILDDIEKGIDEVRVNAAATLDMVHITVSKDANELILKYITKNTKDKYWLTLNSLFWCAYHVSPFLNDETIKETTTETTTETTSETAETPIMAVVWLFNYAQMLWQRNTFIDNWRKYNLKDLLEYKKIIH